MLYSDDKNFNKLNSSVGTAPLRPPPIKSNLEPEALIITFQPPYFTDKEKKCLRSEKCASSHKTKSDKNQK